MKRWLPWIMLVLAWPARATPLVFACEPEWGALIAELMGTRVKVFVAVSPRQDPHHIEARPSLLSAARRADMLVCNGGGLEEGWLPIVVRESGNPHIQPGQAGHFLAADHVRLLDVPARLDRSEGHVHAEGNPHLHLDPRRLLPVARALAGAIGTRLPDLAIDAKAGLARFEADWQSRLKAWSQAYAPLVGARVITHHPSWRYLADWLGLDVVAMLEPKPGVPPNAAHLGRLLATQERAGAQWIMLTSHDDRRGADWLADRTRLPVVVLPYTVESASPGALAALFDTLGQQLLVRARGTP